MHILLRPALVCVPGTKIIKTPPSSTCGAITTVQITEDTIPLHKQYANLFSFVRLLQKRKGLQWHGGALHNSSFYAEQCCFSLVVQLALGVISWRLHTPSQVQKSLSKDLRVLQRLCLHYVSKSLLIPSCFLLLLVGRYVSVLSLKLNTLQLQTLFLQSVLQTHMNQEWRV